MTTKKYSLRKVKVGVASVLVGFGVATTGAVVANAAELTPGGNQTLSADEFKKLDDADKEAAKEAAKEVAAQNEFFANYDKALADSVAELEKAETTSPEEAKAKADVIAKLKKEAAEKKKEIQEEFENGATVADAERFLDEANNPVNPADRKLSKEEETLLKEAHVTQWVTEDGDLLFEEQVENAEPNFGGSELAGSNPGYDKQIINDGFVFIKKEVVGNVTRYIYGNPSITRLTQWVDEDGKILFETTGDQDRNYDEYHSILAKHGYEFDFVDVEDAENLLEEGKTDRITYYVYKKGPNHREITSHIPTVNVPTVELPEFNGGVNGEEPAVLEKPEYPLPTNPQSGSVNTPNFGQDTAKPEVKEASASLPNTGLNSTSTTVAGLGLIALVGLAVRRKLAK